MHALAAHMSNNYSICVLLFFFLTFLSQTCGHYLSGEGEKKGVDFDFDFFYIFYSRAGRVVDICNAIASATPVTSHPPPPPFIQRDGAGGGIVRYYYLMTDIILLICMTAKVEFASFYGLLWETSSGSYN